MIFYEILLSPARRAVFSITDKPPSSVNVLRENSTVKGMKTAMNFSITIVRRRLQYARLEDEHRIGTKN